MNRNPVSHYLTGSMECIDIIKAMFTAEEYAGFLKGNVIKYLYRYKNKGAAEQDLQKCMTYLGWLRDAEVVSK